MTTGMAWIGHRLAMERAGPDRRCENMARNIHEALSRGKADWIAKMVGEIERLADESDLVVRQASEQFARVATLIGDLGEQRRATKK